MKLSLLCIFLLVINCEPMNPENNDPNSYMDPANPKANTEFKLTREMSADPAGKDLLVQTGSMQIARAAHTSTLLTNGHVLICGGFAGNNDFLSSVEIYDPSLNTFRQIGDMTVPRVSHTATLLPDGKVLIAGGYDGRYLSSTEIFDPQTESFTPGSEMNIPRMGHTATLLDNGTILFAGGVGTGWEFLQSAEVYNVDSRVFSMTNSMSFARSAHAALLLTDGTVLVSGGHQGRRANIEIYADAEIYHPATGRFTQTGNMSIRRHKHDMVLLEDGTVLITGGADETDYGGIYKSTEIYYPDLGLFKTSIDMMHPRFKHNGTSVLLPGGNVMVAGGSNQIEIYDPAENMFQLVEGVMAGKRYFSCVTPLTNGEVLITGGYDENISPDNRAWIFRSDKQIMRSAE